MTAENLAHITDHVARGKALLVHQYRTASTHPVIHATLEALLAEVQALEDAIWDVYTLRAIDTATGNTLDMVGTVVLLGRGGRTDDEYRKAIKTRIAINNCQGTPDELEAIYSLITGAFPTEYWGRGLAGFLLQGLIPSFSVIVDEDIIATIEECKPACTQDDLVLYTNPHFGFLGDPNAVGYGTVTDPTIGAPMARALGIKQKPIEYGLIVHGEHYFGFQDDPNALGFGTVTDPSMGAPYARLI